MKRGPRVLVVDDEPAILRTLRTNLGKRGYEVSAAESGEEALRRMDAESPDLVILDLMLPDISGLEVCRRIRLESAVPILVLSARGEERAKVHALDLGADDYVTKPFGMDELLARTRALLRRHPQTIVETGTISAGDIAIDLDTRAVTRAGEPLTLTARELDVLVYLVRHAGKIVPHRLLLSEVWGPEYAEDTQYLRVFINRLRRKIERNPARPDRILTEPGVGYRLQPVLN